MENTDFFTIPRSSKASAAIYAALGTLAYPATKNVAIDTVGDWEVPVGNSAVPLSRILSAMPVDSFINATHATESVDEHWGIIAATLNDVRGVNTGVVGKNVDTVGGY